VIKDEDKAVILLSSLLDEGYETFVLTLINERTFLSSNEVITALVNLELRRKDKSVLLVKHRQRYWPREEVVQIEEEKISKDPIESPW